MKIANSDLTRMARQAAGADAAGRGATTTPTAPQHNSTDQVRLSAGTSELMAALSQVSSNTELAAPSRIQTLRETVLQGLLGDQIDVVALAQAIVGEELGNV